MKTDCILKTNLLNIIKSTTTDNSNAGSNGTTSGIMTDSTLPGNILVNHSTTAPCAGACSACCCAVLMVRYVADCCNDPAAFAEDARQLLKKYPLF